MNWFNWTELIDNEPIMNPSIFEHQITKIIIFINWFTYIIFILLTDILSHIFIKWFDTICLLAKSNNHKN